MTYGTDGILYSVRKSMSRRKALVSQARRSPGIFPRPQSDIYRMTKYVWLARLEQAWLTTKKPSTHTCIGFFVEDVFVGEVLPSLSIKISRV